MDIKDEHIFDGGFGIERETFRVTADGKMARTTHPFPDDKYIDKDFCENQLELITPVCESSDALMDTLAALDIQIREKLEKQGEYLWMYSNPPRIQTEDDITIAEYSSDKAYKHDYRVKLARRYGKRLMLYSGIHLNISFSDALFKSQGGEKYIEYKNELYFRLLKQASRYSWLIVLLTAASPVYDLSLDTDYMTGSGFDGYSSRRSGENGYWNKFIPAMDYTDIHTYAESVREYINNGTLFSASELYLPIRIKPRGVYSLDALENDADHIELRMYDVNPLSPLGIFKEDIDFAHYFLIYLTSLPDFDFTPEMQREAIINHRRAALYDLDKIKIDGCDAREKALGILGDMEKYFNGIARVTDNIAIQKARLTGGARYCEKVYEKYRDNFQGFMRSVKS